MNGELINLLAGGFIAILAGVIGYFVNHFLRLREQKLVREFEVREKGRDFFHQVYGMVSTLTDFVASFLQEDSDEVTVLIEEGYTLQPKEDVIQRYKTTYEEYTEFWFESRKKGLEVFLDKKLVDHLENFWAYAGFFYQNDDWDSHKKNIRRFKLITKEMVDYMDKLLGLQESKLRIPEWLKPRHWKEYMRSVT